MGSSTLLGILVWPQRDSDHRSFCCQVYPGQAKFQWQARMMVLKTFGSGVGRLKIIHRPERDNIGADALSHNAVSDCSSRTDLDEFVLHVCSEDETNDNITDLLTTPPLFLKLAVLINYLENGTLPKEEKEARKTAALATKFFILDKVHYFIDQKKMGRRRAPCAKTPPMTIVTGVSWRENGWTLFW